MDYKKIGLYVLLAVISFALWNAWISDNVVKQQNQVTNVADKSSVPQGVASDTSSLVPTTNNAAVLPPSVAHSVNIPASRLIHVKTDVLDVAIDKLGGNIVDANLLKYPESIKDKTPLVLLNNKPDQLYLAQSGLIAQNHKGPLAPYSYNSAQNNYQLQVGKRAVHVSLNATTADGLHLIKTYTFEPRRYAVKLQYQIRNQGQKAWTGSFYTQLKKRNTPKKKHFMGLNAYVGASMYSPDKPYTQIPYTKFATDNLNTNVRGGWLAMQQQYFLSAWVPNQTTNNTYFTRLDSTGGPSDIYTLGVVTPQITIKPGAVAEKAATLYVGPEEANQLDALAPSLGRTVNYGWLWFLSTPIFKVMQFIHHWVPNWGISIILLTILIKLLFFKLSEISYVSMAKMRQVQPKIKALKERYGDDRQQLGQATMQLYREEKINPLSGCLPMFIQFPFFIALYYVLMRSVELRQASFMFWIQDLSIKDPFYILPLLMVGSMVLQQKMSPQPADDTQAKMMMIMPLVMGLMFASFPAGLVLYWITNSLVSIAQQWYIMKRYDQKHKPQSGSFRKKRA